MAEQISAQQNPLRLLFLEDPINSAEKLVSHFRNTGISTRVHRITSQEDLDDSLSSQPWDLLLAFETSDILPADDVLNTLTRAEKDIPALLLQDNDDSERITQWLSLGGADALPHSQIERLYLVCMRELSNLTQRRQRRINEIALKEAEKRCQLLLDSSVDAIAYVHEGMHIHANPAYVDLFGYDDPDDLEGLSLIDIIHRDNQADFKTFFRQFQQDGTDTPMEFKGQRDDGNDFQATMTLSSAKWDDEMCTQVVIRRAAADPELEKKLEALKSTDLITGLYNRSYFTDQMGSSLEKSLNDDSRFSVMDIRIDNFRDLRKELGVANTDQYLAEIAQKVAPLIEGHGILARYSEDIFTALINHDIHAQLNDLGQQLASTVKKLETRIGTTNVQSTVSIGIMPVTESADSVEYILNRTEQACRLAQKAGGNCLKMHDSQAEMDAKVAEGDTVALVTRALEQNRFQLTYQPILNLEDDAEQQYEVFSCLLGDNDKVVPASEFIAASKRAGLTTRIDRWAILHAIKVLAEHRSKGNETRLFITLGPESMQDPTLPSWINVALRTAKIPGDALIFQLMEEDLALCVKEAATTCQSLKQMQCGLCISHFGGAVDPYETLKKIPADYIKLDSSLIENMDEDDNLQQLQEMATTLSKQGRKVMVPRVENSKTLSTLWQCDVNYVQGYYLQTPSEAMDYEFD